MEIQVTFRLNTKESAVSAVSALKKAKQLTTSAAKLLMRPAIALMKEIDFQMTAAALRNASRDILLEASESQSSAKNAGQSTMGNAHENHDSNF